MGMLLRPSLRSFGSWPWIPFCGIRKVAGLGVRPMQHIHARYRLHKCPLLLEVGRVFAQAATSEAADIDAGGSGSRFVIGTPGARGVQHGQAGTGVDGLI